MSVKFYSGQYEDCSPGEITSDSSETALKRQRGNGQYICDSGEGGIRTVKHVSFQKVSTSLVELCWS